MTAFRVVIDRSLCSGFGTCADLAPNLIELGKDGIAAARVGETDDERLLDAAASCPMGAISVFETATGAQAA